MQKKKFFLNQEKYDFISFADNLAQRKAQFNTEDPVFIRADKSLKYDDVISVLRSVKNLGFNKVVLQTE